MLDQSKLQLRQAPRKRNEQFWTITNISEMLAQKKFSCSARSAEAQWNELRETRQYQRNVRQGNSSRTLLPPHSPAAHSSDHGLDSLM
jgi:hypothetical protein